MTTLRSDLARRIRARSKHTFGWSIKIVAEDSNRLRLITYNPYNKSERAEEVITVDLEEYARTFHDEDARDTYIDGIIRSFLFPVRPC